jgi:hypothetical protein
MAKAKTRETVILSGAKDQFGCSWHPFGMRLAFKLFTGGVARGLALPPATALLSLRDKGGVWRRFLRGLAFLLESLSSFRDKAAELILRFAQDDWLRRLGVSPKFSGGFVAFLLLAVLGGFLRADDAPKKPELWFYYPVNLLPDENIPKLQAVFQRAAAAGYTQVFLDDSKFGRLGAQPASYAQNVEKVKKIAADLHLEIVPGIFPIGWSDSLLSSDPNLVEALPVRNALFAVKNGAAQPVDDPAVRFPEETFSDPKKWREVDDDVHFESGAAHVSGAKGINARVAAAIDVAPFRQYDLTVRIKTQGYTAEPMVLIYSPDLKDSLNDVDLDVKPTQDWTTYHIVFNSLDHDKLLVYFRAGWSGSDGEMWWDQPKIREAGLLNIVRRDSDPLTVRTEDGRTLAEGKDFAPVADPRMGQVPWPGEYEVWHEPPVLKTSLPDGTRLRVSFCHAITTGRGKVTISLADPKTLDLLRDQAQRMVALFHAKRYFMQHDEIRVMGWDDAAAATHLDSGAILAANIRACTKIMNEAAPGATLYVWSDMFDPYHNAHDHYYLVKGNLAGSWEGLDPSVVMANWNSDHPADSLPWFAKRGHHQLLAGYYDAPPEQIVPWLKAAQGVQNVDAVMYTTWASNYDDLEKFAKVVQNFYAQ